MFKRKDWDVVPGPKRPKLIRWGGDDKLDEDDEEMNREAKFAGRVDLPPHVVHTSNETKYTRDLVGDYFKEIGVEKVEKVEEEVSEADLLKRKQDTLLKGYGGGRNNQL